jgi:hypothetical protein
LGLSGRSWVWNMLVVEFRVGELGLGLRLDLGKKLRLGLELEIWVEVEVGVVVRVLGWVLGDSE